MDLIDLRMFPSNRKSIPLRTMRGTEVPNYVAPEPDERETAAYQRLRSRFTHWESRNGPGGGYNCFGHVFAARRCAIARTKDVETILSDDGYEQVTPLELRVGDVVLFRRSDGSGEIDHVAVVLFHRPRPSGGGEPPWLLSKWNETCGEDVHPWDEYLGDSPGHEREIWRFVDDFRTSPPTVY